jgi:N-acetylglucosaminyl-diphospho-decaprenol L-rhamnosyltransferase
MSLTVVIVTFKSDHIIENLIKSIPEKYSVLIVENSLNKELKKKLELNYKNVEVYIPIENLGYSGGVNYGVTYAKTKFVFCLVADVIFQKSTFFSIDKICNTLNDFAILAPTFNDQSVFKNYIEKKEKKSRFLNIDGDQLLEVKEVDGAAFIINKEKFKGKVMDDKFFMYFESTDMCFNTVRNNEKIYVILNIKFDHMGLKSSEIKYHFEIIKNRNWHYCWSKFYYYKKNFNFILALSKITPNIIRSVATMTKSLIKKDHVSYEYSKAELSGIMSSLLNKKSYYRPKIS